MSGVSSPSSSGPSGDVDGPRVSVLVPALDEAPNMPPLFSELAESFEKHGLDAEVVLVDDGSTDGTADAAEEAASAAGLADRTRILRHRANRGKTEAMLTAARAARGRYFVLFDADLQHSPEAIPRFVDELDEGWDVVTGRKVGRAYSKRFVSTVYNWLARKIFGVPVRDLNAMKAFRREVLEEVRLRHGWHRFFVVLAHAQGYSVTEIEVELLPRRAGSPKYEGQGRIVVGTLDLISVWFQLVFSRKPMLLFGVSGALLVVLGVLTGMVTLYLRFVLEQGYRPLLNLVVLLTVVGLLLFAVGFLAELMASLRLEVDDLRHRLERAEAEEAPGGPPETREDRGG